MDVARLAKVLGVTDPAVVRKAKEFTSLAAVRSPGGMGQGSVCAAAVCLELACMTMQHSNQELTREKFVKHGCVNAKVYTQTFNMLHQALGVNRRIDLQHLVVQFGCASVRQSVVRVQGLYKERFLAKLSDADRPNASFARPVFLAVAFYLVARKNKIAVDQRALLETLCVSREDFQDISASMYQLCFDVVGVEKTKQKATKRKTNTSVLDAHRHDEDASASEPEAEAGPSGAGAGAGDKPRSSKRARQQEDYDEWKLRVLSGMAGGAGGGADTGGSKEQGQGAEGCGKGRAGGEDQGGKRRLTQSKLVLKERQVQDASSS